MLVITGARTAGVAGAGTFISNGGSLKLDTVLNEGGVATHSDTLVVDGTSVGPNGATMIAIRNAGGAGALTVGDGILVAEVLDPTRSAAGVFSLAARLRPGHMSTGCSTVALTAAIPPIGSCARRSIARWRRKLWSAKETSRTSDGRPRFTRRSRR